MEAMGIAYLDLQRSGLHPLDCRVQPGTGIASISLMDMYAHLYVNYGQVTEGIPRRMKIGNNSAIRICDPSYGTVPLQDKKISTTTW